MKTRSTLVVLACSCVVGLTAQTASQGSVAPFNDSSRVQDMKARLFFLASDETQGRLSDTVGARLAAEWVKSEFWRLGLTPAGPNGWYFQPFDLVTATLGTRADTLAFPGGANDRRDLAHLAHFYTHRFYEGDAIKTLFY